MHESLPINVKVDGSPRVLLKGIGPNQVVTGATKLSLNSNVKLENVSYVLTNVVSGTKRALAADLGQGFTFTPAKTDPAALAIHVEGTYQGKKISSESISIKIYLDTLYGPQAIIEKDRGNQYDLLELDKVGI